MHQTYQPLSSSRQSGHAPKPPRIRFTRVFKLLFILFLVAIVVIAAPRITLFIQQKIQQEQERIIQQKQTQFSSSLSAAINPILNAHQNYTIGVAITDIKTGTTRAYGATSSFEAASTGKLLTALAYYHAVESGDKSLTDTVGAYSAQFQLQQMINRSNNQSWALLVGELGESTLQQYATSIGSDYSVEGNTITPTSMAQVLAKLHKGTLINATHTAELLAYMQNTNDEDMIPASVSNDVTVYHKYGLLDGNLHDVGILTKNNSALSIAIYTKNTDDSDDTARGQVIGSIAQTAATTFFSSNNPNYP